MKNKINKVRQEREREIKMIGSDESLVEMAKICLVW